jgi:uncharacterized damage-inducible protein DinB
VWWRPNEQSNSVGNLLMHLAGNIRQWIVSGVGGAPSTRDRAAEFAATSGVGAAGLLATLEEALDDVDAVLASLSASDLLSTRTIQGRELSVLEAVLSRRRTFFVAPGPDHFHCEIARARRRTIL